MEYLNGKKVIADILTLPLRLADLTPDSLVEAVSVHSPNKLCPSKFEILALLQQAHNQSVCSLYFNQLKRMV